MDEYNHTKYIFKDVIIATCYNTTMTNDKTLIIILSETRASELTFTNLKEMNTPQ
jgi:hypothetical protein